MEDYKFIYPGANEYETAAMNRLISEYFKQTKDEPTLENLTKAYKQSLVSLIRILSMELGDYLAEREFYDVNTQRKIIQKFADHVNYHIKDILAGINFDYGVVTQDGTTFSTNYESDMKQLNDYFAGVHAIAINASIKELGDEIEQIIVRDLELMEELYKLSKSWTDEQQAEELANFCKTRDPSLLEKYGAIIFNFKQFGFNSEAFKYMIVQMFYNLSMPYSEILMKYFKRAVKKDKNYQRNLAQIREFITQFMHAYAKQREEQEQTKQSIQEGASEMYSTIN